MPTTDQNATTFDAVASGDFDVRFVPLAGSLRVASCVSRAVSKIGLYHHKSLSDATSNLCPEQLRTVSGC